MSLSTGESRIAKAPNDAVTFQQMYDTLINLGDEAAFIWSQRWSVGKTLYLLARYTAIIDAVVLFWCSYGPLFQPVTY